MIRMVLYDKFDNVIMSGFIDRKEAVLKVDNKVHELDEDIEVFHLKYDGLELVSSKCSCCGQDRG